LTGSITVYPPLTSKPIAFFKPRFEDGIVPAGRARSHIKQAGNVLLNEAFSSRSCEPVNRFAAGNYGMLGHMIRVLPLLIMLIYAAVCSADSVETITADDWARPRTGESLVDMPALKRTVRDYLGHKSGPDNRRGQRILIRHPRGEEGVLWAEELRGWLIALGVPFADIDVSPDSTRVDAIELALIGADN
jgi:hypothetical protein